MAFCQVNHFSPSLQKMTSVTVAMREPCDDTEYAVFYLLHGLSDDHSAWFRQTSIERYIGDLPMLIVMPDGGRGFYVNAPGGPRYASAIVEDTIRRVDTTFRTRRSRDARAIGGLSMGGYGALKLGLQRPDLFCSVNSHSGAAAFAHRRLDSERDREWIPIFGEDPAGGPEDPFAHAEKVPHDRLPALRIDCGTDDFLIDANRRFHQHLDTLGIPHEYVEYPGGHDWAYWDEHVREAIAFHALNMGLIGTT